MTILTLLALLLVVMLVASALPARTPLPPTPVILVQAVEPAGSPSTGCLPLILLVAAVVVALTML